MNTFSPQAPVQVSGIQKCPTGIEGLDEVLNGGLPRGRPTLVCGSAGCGKTLMACEFLVRGVQKYGEPGVFISFEEMPQELSANVASLGMDLDEMVRRGEIFVDYIHIDRSEIEETGEYDLSGLFIRLDSAINEVGAKRVVIDTIETIFSGFSNTAILRSELRRLFRWLKEKGVTALVTGERGEGTLTRHGLEEYVSDCVILLDNRVQNNLATRMLRVVKYRGSSHGPDEYPFLISDKGGMWVLPITSIGLNYPISNDFISTGVPRLDYMLDGKGFYRGSSVLVSGTSGTGKTSLAAHVVDAACRRGERCLYFAYEESSEQIIRNMRSIGIDLGQWVDQGLLCFQAVRPSLYGSEMHLLSKHKLTEEFDPSVVIVDPISNMAPSVATIEHKSLMVRMIDFFKMKGITAFFTSLIPKDLPQEISGLSISSLMDTWIVLQDVEANGERNRTIFIMKARGQAHSNQVREFRLTDNGIDLIDVYAGPEGVLTGAARLSQEKVDQAELALREQQLEHKKRELERNRKMLLAQIEVLQSQIAAEEEDYDQALLQSEQNQQAMDNNRKVVAQARMADSPEENQPSRNTEQLNND